MKPEIHPEYRLVLFQDVSCNFEFLCRSTVQTRETGEYNGQEYPLVKLDISSKSHPFYTGTQRLMDTAGRVEKYYRKYGFKRPEGMESEAPEAESEN